MAGPSGEEKAAEDHSSISASAYNCFSSDIVSGNNNSNNLIQAHLLRTFEPTQEDIYSNNEDLPSTMEMVGFLPPSSSRTNLQENSSTWKGLFFNKPGINPSSSTKAVNDPTSSVDHHHQQQQQLYHHHDLTTAGVSDYHHSTTSEAAAMMVPWNSSNNHHHHHGQNSRSSLVMDDPSLRCVFPCEANERPSQGLSLSLSSSNPSAIGLQSFELRAQNDNDLMRFGPSSSRAVVNVQSHHHHHHQSSEFLQAQFQIRGSQYLGPVQDLLNEFCSLGTNKETADKMKAQNRSEGEEDESSSGKKDALYSLDIMELQRRKTKLFQMLEELDRRYKHYCNQMKAVVSSFEAVAGEGSANIYSALASKAMSRHFRCLRDGIAGQIKATKKAMGEKDSVAPAGTVRGETPRLRILDQTLRQQKAIQQMHMMDAHPWRPQRGLPERSVSVLRAWLFEHFLHPYPSDVDKHILARQTGLSRSQVSNWFINARVRLWKPMVEEMYLEELKEQEGDGVTTHNNIIGSSSLNNNLDSSENLLSSPRIDQDRKPSHNQLMQNIDTGSLSSIISHSQDKNKKIDKSTASLLLDHHHHHSNEEPYISFGNRVEDHHQNSYGHNTIDFSSYGGNNSGGVSLTLGLHHQNAVTSGGGGHMDLAFSSSSAHQISLFYSNPTREEEEEEEEDCQQTVQQYSLLDGDQGQTLPYRNLMGAQLLRDLAG